MADVGYIRFDASSVREVIRQELEELQFKIAENIRAKGLNASGRTIASMHVETTENGGTLFGRAFSVLWRRAAHLTRMPTIRP